MAGVASAGAGGTRHARGARHTAPAAARAPRAPQPRDPYRQGTPLGLLVARYFVYVLAGLALLAALLLAASGVLLNMAAIYPANYGAQHVEETKELIAAQKTFDDAAIPAAYRFARFSADGALVSSDMPPAQLEQAQRLAESGAEAQADGQSFLGQGASYAGVSLPDGTRCVLSYQILPQFASKELRDALPNPQNILLAAFALGSVAIVAGLAVRASRVIERKMSPLVEAAAHIERQDLDFPVPASNVRQINRVLGAMERMRASLKESLEARWRAEEAQRAQVAALAHDLKTPLTVVRANAEYLAEDACAQDDLRASALAAAQAARQLDDYVQRIIATAREGVSDAARTSLAAEALACALTCEAERLADAVGARLQVRRTPAFEALAASAELEADRDALVRAGMNLVGNAFDHAPAQGGVQGGACLIFDLAGEGDALSLSVAVDDEGGGFSPQALARGCERFFRDDAARTGKAGGAAGTAGARREAGGAAGGPSAAADASAATDAQARNEASGASDSDETGTRQAAEAAGTARSGGAAVHFGLGLSIASQIAHAHGGAIELSNRTDAAGRTAGARARLVVPCRRTGGPR